MWPAEGSQGTPQPWAWAHLKETHKSCTCCTAQSLLPLWGWKMQIELLESTTSFLTGRKETKRESSHEVTAEGGTRVAADKDVSAAGGRHRRSLFIKPTRWMLIRAGSRSRPSVSCRVWDHFTSGHIHESSACWMERQWFNVTSSERDVSSTRRHGWYWWEKLPNVAKTTPGSSLWMRPIGASFVLHWWC